MDRFPDEFSQLLTARGRDFLLRRTPPPADLTRDDEHFFVLANVLDRPDACVRILEREFEGKLGPIRATIPPEWITGMRQNFGDTFGKTMDVRSHIFRDPDSELYQSAQANGLLPMLHSESLWRFAEAVTGLRLESGWGSQIICYEHGHYVGPHNDHFPEFEWARDGYVDVQLMFANDAVEHQAFVHEKNGLLSQSWNINLTGAVSVFRQPFWHYTTPLLAKPGHEREARRWLIGQVFRIVDRAPAPAAEDGGDAQQRRTPEGQRGRRVIPAASAAPGATVEQNKRLSESLLWEWQRRFYTERGVSAWSEGTVPSRVTSGAYLAAAYARIVRSFLLDGRQPAASNESAPIIDPNQPLYILELGAGTGRFAHVFLDQLLAALPADAPPIRYVLTDLAERNLAAWTAHRLLQPHIEAERADIAILDAREDGEIQLRESGEALAPGSLRNPLVVVANYFFDSIEHDLFRTEDGDLKEVRVSIQSTRPRESDLSDPELLERCELSFGYQQLASPAYVDDDLNLLLDGYRTRRPSTFLLPVGALHVLKRAHRLADCGLLVLAADKGHLTKEAVLRDDEPLIALHGSISMMVNFDALITYCETHGGFALRTSPAISPLAVCAFFLGLPSAHLQETQLAFQETITSFGPLERHQLAQQYSANETLHSLEESLAVLHMTGDDPAVLSQLAPTLREQIGGATDALADEITNTLARAWRNYFPIGEESDLAFEIATIKQLLGQPAEAVNYYERSLDSHGDHYTTRHNLGLCYLDLERPEDALKSFEAALSLNPDYQPARKWHAQAASELPATVTEDR